jgi:hypothetical protein
VELDLNSENPSSFRSSSRGSNWRICHTQIRARVVVKNTQADKTILAGDTHTKGRGPELSASYWPDRPVVMVRLCLPPPPAEDQGVSGGARKRPLPRKSSARRLTLYSPVCHNCQIFWRSWGVSLMCLCMTMFTISSAANYRIL